MTTLRIKRSPTSGNPATLAQGELAYSYLTNNGSNGGDILYVGTGTETSGNAANHVKIGGLYYTTQVDNATALNTVSTIVKRDASGNFVAGTITAALTGNADTASKLFTARTIAFTGDATASGSFDGSANYSQALTFANVNSNVQTIALTGASGSGTQITFTYALQASAPYVTGQQVTVSGASPSGYNSTWQVFSSSTTQTIAVLIGGGNATFTTAYVSGGTITGLFGSQTYIPVITVNAKGLVTAITNTAISTTLNLAGGSASSGSVNLNGGTLTFTGGNGITTSVSGSTVTVSSTGAGGYTSTATAAGTTTLTASSTANQFFTGTTTQTVKLPSTATLTLGQEFFITNNSTGAVTVQTSASGTIVTIPAGAQNTFIVASTSAETWVNEFTGFSALTGLGAAVLANSPTLTGHPTIEGVTSTGATGTGNLVFGTSPTLVTPTLGVATATSVNKLTITAPATGSTLTIADGKTLTASNTLTFTGTDSSSVAFGAGGTVVYTSNNLSVFAATTSAQLAGVISDETGSGSLVFGTSPSLTTPSLTTPSITTSASFNGGTSGSTVIQATAIATGTLTLPAATDTLVGKATTDVFTNKTFDTAGTGNVFKINGTSITAVTGTGYVVLASSPTITTPTFASGGVTLTGSTSGTTILQPSGTASGTLTLPAATDTLVGKATTDTLTNKTINGANNTITIRAASDITGQLPVANGGTGTSSGSITGTGALTFTAGGTNTNINLVPNGTGTVDVGSTRITNLATPTQTSDAATKGYVDAVKQALDIKDSVRVATTANLAVTASGTGAGKTLTNSGTQAALTIDSIVLVVGNRVLVKDQTTQADNGIYTVTTVGSASVNWVLTRAVDADNSPTGEVTPGMFTFVEEGTVNQDSGWVLTTDGSVTIDTTALTFVQFSGAGQIIAGTGITKTGNTLSIDTSVVVDKTTAQTLTNKTLGTSSVWNGSLIGATYGGTGVNNGSNTITLGGNISTAGAFTTSGAFGLTLTTTALTNVTLPTSGTLVNTSVTTLSSLTSIGTIATGVWNATAVGPVYGGTGISAYSTGDTVYASATNTLSKLAIGSTGQLLQVSASGIPTWADLDGGTY